MADGDDDCRRVFVYGSLMSARVLARVFRHYKLIESENDLDRVLERTLRDQDAAVACGYRRVRVRGCAYPAMIRADSIGMSSEQQDELKNAQVRGRVLNLRRESARDALAALDQFEGVAEVGALNFCLMMIDGSK